MPDINQALRHGGGLRYPWDYVKVWWHRRRIDCVSLKIVAVLPAYQSTGLGSLLYLELAKRLLRKSFRWVDLSLTGEDNPQTNRIAAVFGATIYKTTPLFEKLFGLPGLDRLPDPSRFDPTPEDERELRDRLLRAGEQRVE